VRLTGPLHLAALERSLAEIVKRHESLRTSFVAEEGRPHQVIAPFHFWYLPHVDLSDLTMTMREPEALRLAQAEAARPFQLAQGPLMRATLVRLSKEDHLVLLTMHHIIADDWSVGVLTQELSALYPAFVAGQPSPLSDLSIQYADFAIWQRQRLRAEVLADQLAYWQQQLAGAAVLELPTDRPRPPVQNFRGASQAFALPQRLSEGLQSLSQREGVTLFMTLLAAFQALLQRYSRQDEISLGTPIAGRTQLETENVIGFFTNTLVLRLSLAGNPTLHELLHRVRELTLEADAHQDLPFEKLVEVLQPERDLSLSPLFQVMFTLHNAPQPALALPGLTLSQVPIETGGARYDLNLELWETATGLQGAFRYATDLFEIESIQRLSRNFQMLLEAFVAQPEQRLANIALLTAAERRQLLEWNDTQTAYPDSACIHQLIEAQAARSPDAVAAVFEAGHITYAALERKANQLAHHLQSLGVGPEVRVGLCVERSLGLIVGLLGILKAGGSYIPLDPAYPRERLAYMVTDGQASVLVTQQQLLSLWAEIEIPQVYLEANWATTPPTESQALQRDVNAENLAYLIYTSGSTGQPKGVQISHQAVVNCLMAIAHQPGLTAQDCWLALTTISFDIAALEIFLPLMVGARLVIASQEVARDGDQLRAALTDSGATVMQATPVTWQLLLETGMFSRPKLKMLCGGQALPRKLAQALQSTGASLWNLFGPTETTIWSTLYPVDASAEGPVPIGRPMANTQVYVLDSNGQLAPLGVPGELYIGGAGLARGYFRQPALTAERFIPNSLPHSSLGDRLYKTGDLVRWRPNGTLEFLGRVDHQVKIRGFRIELGEIESILSKHSGVREAVVVVRPAESSKAEQRLVAYVVLNPNSQATPHTLRRFLGEHLPEYMLPTAFILLSALPLTPNGKIDRRALPAPAAERPTWLADYEAPQGPQEELLATLWSEVLGIESISRQDNFFSLGGHSLLAAQLISRIRRTFQLELPLITIFEQPTLAGLANGLTRAAQTTSEPQLPLSPVTHDQPLPLSYVQERLWFLDQLTPGNPTYNIASALRLQGPLMIAALIQSVNEVIRRHAILRTTFSNAQGQPLQVIASNLKGTLPVIDLRDIPQPQREAEALRLAAEEARRSFDLSRGPLVRTQVIELDQTEHVALLTIHHIVADGWSMAVLLRELTALYAAYSLGRPSPLPELPVQYADFAVWQRGWLQGETLQSQLAYWKKQIEGTVTLDLPTDYPRPIIQTYAGASTTLRLAQALSESLKTFSRQAGVTLFMSLLAAFKILLQRYTGQDDLSLGSPIAGRTRAEVEPLIGFFINTLVLRTDLSGNPTFRELVGRVRQTTLGAYAHQDIPFEQLLEALQPERDLSRTPLFQILFNMLNFPEVKTRLPSGLTLEHVPTPENGSKFDLTLHVEDQPDGLRFDLVYNPDLFSDARMIELLAQYEFLLQQVLQDPNIPIGQYSLVTPATRPKLPDPTETLDDGWIGAVHEIVSRHARRAPQQVAIVDRQASWTYDTLEVRSNQLAQALQAQGIQRGDIIAIYAHRSAALIWAILGVFKAGAAFVIFDPNLPTARLTKYLQIARPQGWLQIAAAGALPEALATCLKDLGCHCRWELPAEPGPEALNPFSQYPSQAPLVAVGPDDLASIVFTSGSTGQPKVVIGHHGSLTHFMPWFGQTFGMSSTDRFSLLAGIAFDFLQRELFTSLCLGATLCLPDPDYFSTPGWLASWLRQQAITIIHLTPATGQLLTEGVRESIPSLRTAFFIGEALTRGDAARLKQLAPNLTCINLYGSTEGQRAVSYYVIADPLNSQAGAEHSPRRVREIIPLGRGIQDVQLILLNTAQQLAGVGEIGEIYLRSPHLGIGYKDDEALTRERFRLNPFTQRPGDRINKTGDLGRYLPDGNVESLGRADQQVKIRGFRLELGEVEAALRSHAAVRECAVVARHLNTTPEAPARDKRLVAYLVRREAQTQPVTVDQLHRFLKERLPDYMLPAAYVFLEALPLTPTRKVDRQALPAPELIRPELQETFVAPRTPTEEVLAGIWATVLGLEQVGIHDNFFALGGHSLLATRVFSRLRDTFQIEVPLRALFESPTVAGLAEHIEGVRRVAASLATPPIVRAERVGELPLSFSQLRLWFLDQLSPGNAFYNLFHAIRIAGLLDIAAFEHSLQAIIQRHESLQTTFVAVAGRPGQVITDCLPWRLPLIDLSALPSPTRETEARQLARRAAQQPFDLAQGPLLRTTLVYLGDQEHLVLLTLHHIVADEWSLGIFVEEVAAFYTAFVAGQVATLPPLPIQYLDFALWQQRWLQGTTLAGQLEYWQAQLAGLTPLELPTDRPRPAVQTHRGAKQSLSIPLSLTTDLRTLSQQEETTLFMTLLAAFQTLLHRYSGQDEVCVGTPIAGRTRTELENVIGYFANTIVLRTSLAGNPTVRELLQRVRAVTLAAYTHQDLPFEKLVELLQPERDLSRNPLFQILFALHNTPQPTLALPGLALTALEVDTDTARFDLSLDLWEGPHGLQGVFEYNTDLFEAETISRLGEHYKIILAALTAEPQQFLAQLSVLTPVEEQQILQTWNSPPLITPASCLHQLVEAQAARQPDAIALSGSGASLTYSELNRRANQLAHYLQQYGVGPEILVGVYLERSAEVVLALLAILKAGGAYVPLDPAYPTERISFMLADAGASVLLTQTQLAAQLPTPSTPVICLEADWPAIAQFGVSNLQSQTDPDNLAYVIYTSGSTGKPKGVQVSHRSVGSLLAATHELVCGDPQDVWTVFHSYAFDFSVWEIWTPLSQGSRLVVLPVEVTQTPEALHDVLHAEQVTILNQTPSAVRQLLAAHSDNDLSLRALMCGGEAFPGDLAMALLRWGIPVRNFYGPTEATVWAASQVVESEMLIEGTVPVGRPLPNSQIYLLGKQRQLAPIGVPGEIHIGGSGLARGYLHRPELTAEKFIPHPFSPEPGQRLYRTGDLGRYRPDGVVEFLGRLDHQVKIRGFRIELGEIENVLSQHPAIQEVVVLARPPAIGSDSAQLVAYWVPGTEPAPTVTELRGFLKQQLPEYMVPAAFVSLRTLPLTPNGKIDRRALPEPDTTRPTLQAAFVAPRNPREKLLAQIWAELLGLERIGIHDNFFDLGGNSLLVIRIIARAQQAGLAITTRQLFQHQTIAELAQAVGSIHLQAEQGVIVGPAPLSPAQRQFFERNYARPDYYNLATLLEALGPLNPVHLEQAFRVLLVHHDSLRLQLVTEGPDWQQTIAPLGEQVPFVWVNVTALSEAQQIQVIQTVLVQLQTSFNLFEGPLIRMALFEGAPPTPPRLLIVCHYLPADILSWQILLSDLDTTYQQLNQAQPAQLPPKTTSFKEWVERLAHYAASSKIRAEVEYWLDEARAQAGPLPVDYPGGVNTVASVKTVAVQLDLTETQRLIQLVVPAVDAQINEVIFTALAQAFARWTGSPTLLMDLVGHGRESLFEDMDLTRTIGWLNTLFPVFLNLGDALTEPAAALQTVKEQVRRIPNHGVGYGILRYLSPDPILVEKVRALPQAEVYFNYVDELVPQFSLYQLIRIAGGFIHERGGRRGYLLSITGNLLPDGRLQLTWEYSANVHRPETINTLAQDTLNALRTFIAQHPLP
jgi:amino acid adenylation domain-containing protein/non-ribosomal peptide synthase protein (TIGR01720 family)